MLSFCWISCIISSKEQSDGGHLHSFVPASFPSEKRGVWRQTQVHFHVAADPPGLQYQSPGSLHPDARVVSPLTNHVRYNSSPPPFPSSSGPSNYPVIDFEEPEDTTDQARRDLSSLRRWWLLEHQEQQSEGGERRLLLLLLRHHHLQVCKINAVYCIYNVDCRFCCSPLDKPKITPTKKVYLCRSCDQSMTSPGRTQYYGQRYCSKASTVGLNEWWNGGGRRLAKKSSWNTRKKKRLNRKLRRSEMGIKLLKKPNIFVN